MSPLFPLLYEAPLRAAAWPTVRRGWFERMIDIHCHLLPGVDDGARHLDVSLEMARIAAAEGVTTIACTPHIQPGVFDNDAAGIREAVQDLQEAIDEAGIAVTLVVGSDAHIRPDFVSAIRAGEIATLNDTKFVLFEPPHHIAPQRMDDLLFDILAAGYVPIVTHPERLTWISSHYELFVRLSRSGVWMQITAGSLTGSFGRGPKMWAERMLIDGVVHVIATDAHGAKRRPPLMRDAIRDAERLVGPHETQNLVSIRPRAILLNSDEFTPPKAPCETSPPPKAKRGAFWPMPDILNRAAR